MIVDPPLKLDSEESNFVSSCYGPSTENQSNEVISKMVSTNLLKLWDESKTNLHPSSIAMTTAEHSSLKFFVLLLNSVISKPIFQ